MAYYKSKVVGGQEYLYVYETHLVDGKPRPVMLAYLGKADAALTRLQGAGAREEIRTFAHGAVAVMLSLADRLGVAAMIDRAARAPRKGAPERKGPTVGETLVLGAIGLAVEPTSKRGFASWATTTTLPVLVGFGAEKLTSQYFWDQMDRVSERALEGIGAEFAKRVIEFAGIELDTLFYDSTNYYTFIDSANERCDVARRGNSKQKRSDLRQVNVGLLVARDGWLPLRHDIYRGNLNDVSRFPDALDGMRERLAALAVSPDDVTLVCDKGNISRANWPRLDATGLHHVTSLPPARMRDLTERPLDEFTQVDVPDMGTYHTLRATRMVAERERTVVVLDSPTLRDGQLRGLGQTLMRPVGALAKLAYRLRSGRRCTRARLENQVNRIVRTAGAARSILRWEIADAGDGHWALDWWIDEDSYAHLRDRQYGRRLLVTDRAEWSTSAILSAYWGASEAEHAFAMLKDPHHCAIHTPHHWTTQKLAVHTFMAVLAYAFMALIRRQARPLGLTESAATLVEMLDGIRMARLRQVRSGPGRRSIRWQPEETEDSAAALYRAMVSPEHDLGSIIRGRATRTARTG